MEVVCLAAPTKSEAFWSGEVGGLRFRRSRRLAGPRKVGAVRVQRVQSCASVGRLERSGAGSSKACVCVEVRRNWRLAGPTKSEVRSRGGGLAEK